jgi:hypothetical protein
LVAGVLACSPTAPSNITLGRNTESMTWNIKNSCRASVDVRLFDITTGGVWPAPGRVRTLDSGVSWLETIECNRNSRVCYGAGIRGNYSLYWGGGINNDQSCSECCHPCDGSSPQAISLTSNSAC